MACDKLIRVSEAKFLDFSSFPCARSDSRSKPTLPCFQSFLSSFFSGFDQGSKVIMSRTADSRRRHGQNNGPAASSLLFHHIPSVGRPGDQKTSRPHLVERKSQMTPRRTFGSGIPRLFVLEDKPSCVGPADDAACSVACHRHGTAPSISWSWMWQRTGALRDYSIHMHSELHLGEGGRPAPLNPDME